MNKFRLGKKWLYIPLVVMAIFYLIPMYVMLVTGFKSFAEVDLTTMWNLPKGIHFDNYIEAFSKLAPSLGNSFIMVIPAAIISSVLGSLNGFILAKWKFRGADAAIAAVSTQRRRRIQTQLREVWGQMTKAI